MSILYTHHMMLVNILCRKFLFNLSVIIFLLRFLQDVADHPCFEDDEQLAAFLTEDEVRFLLMIISSLCVNIISLNCVTSHTLSFNEICKYLKR